MAPHEMSQMRVSDAERDQVAQILREAAGEGRLGLDELDERLDAVYAAKTYADLEPVTADLPGGLGGSPGSAAPPPAVVARGPLAGGGQPLTINAKGGSATRKGEWTVPHRVEVDARFGSTKLDFRQARITTPVVEVRVDSSWGGGDVILPEGATAEVDVDASWFGTLTTDVDSIRRPEAPHFVITGACQGGSLRVRYKRSGGWADLFG